MTGILAVLGVLVPIVELIVFVLMADLIGIIPTILLLVAISFAGAVLLFRQGVSTLRRLREAIKRREMPSDDLADAALLTVAALLLLVPGFFSDGLAFLVVIPPTRRVLRGALRRFVAVVAGRRVGWKTGAAAVAGKKIHDVQATKRATRSSDPPQDPAQLPSSGHPSDEGDSRDTG